MPDYSDLARRLAVADSDDPLWADLLRVCQREVRKVLWFRHWTPALSHPSAVDEVVQGVAERLLANDRQGLRRFAEDGYSHFERYLRRVVENAVRDQVRQQAVRISLLRAVPIDHVDEGSIQLASLEDVSADRPETSVETREMQDTVERVLTHVAASGPDRAVFRRLFQLYFLDGRSTTQIARMPALSISVSSVSRRIAILRESLRAALTGEPLPARPVRRAAARIKIRTRTARKVTRTRSGGGAGEP